MFSVQLILLLILCDFSEELLVNISECEGYDQTITVNETEELSSGCQFNENNTVATCNSLDKALNLPLTNSCMVLLTPVNMNELKNLSNIKNFKMISSGKPIVCNQTQTTEMGILFRQSNNIILSKITIKNCGFRLKYNENEYLSTALAFVRCSDVSLIENTIRQNNGYGLTFINTGGVMTSGIVYGNFPEIIQNNNSHHAECYSGGGAFILFSQNTENLKLEINQDTIFSATNYNNNGKYNGDGDSKNANIFDICRKGSGMAIYFLNQAEKNEILVKETSIISNSAKSGGGIYILFSKQTQNNLVLFQDVEFGKNIADNYGGAIYIKDDSNMKNQLHILNCDISDNQAKAGAAICLTHSDDITIENAYGYNKFNFQINDTDFNGNHALIGEALYIENVNVKIHSINITMSNVQQSEPDSGQGALYTLRSSLYFTGESNFIKNNNSALILDSSLLSLDGSMKFINNLAYNGGAIRFYENSQLELSTSAKLLFFKNQAVNKGGAVYVVTPGPLVMPFLSTELTYFKCFFTIKEEDAHLHDHFEGNVTFVDNMSVDNISNDIFTTSLESCRNPGEKPKDIFTTWPNFYFTSNHSVSSHAVKIMPLKKQQWSPYSGQIFNATILLYDQRENVVSENINVKLSGSAVIVKSNSAFSVEDKKPITLALKGPEKTSFDVTVTTTSGIPLEIKLPNQTLGHCPFGFIVDDNTAECICDVLYNLENGIAECTNDHIFLLKNRWVNKYENESLVCPFGYCKCTKDTNITPYCLYNSDMQCNENRNQSSRLCSRCINTYSSIMGSTECTNRCHGSKSYTYIPILTFLCVAVVIGAIMLLDVDIMSYNINIYLFAYQIIDLLYDLDQNLDTVLNILVAMVQINYRDTVYTYCLWDGLNPMEKYAYCYIIPVSSVIIMFVLYHCHYKWPHRIPLKRWYKALSIISIVCFSNLLRVSFNLLSPVQIDGKWYLYIYAEVPFFGKEHYPYGVAAVIVVCLVMTSLVISIIAVFKEEVVWHRKPLNWISHLKANICVYIRDGVHWFWIFYIGCRILMFSVGIFTEKDQTQKCVLCILCFLMLIALATFQPYEEEQRNLVESLVLLALTIISVLTFGMGLVYFHHIRHVHSIIIHILSYVPLLAVLWGVFFRLYQKFYNERNQFLETVSSTEPLRAYENDQFKSGYNLYNNEQGEED